MVVVLLQRIRRQNHGASVDDLPPTVATTACRLAVWRLTRQCRVSQGPAIGGWLSTPADSMPRVFSKTGVFGRNPYLLPCVASGVISTVTLFLAVLYLEETLDPKFRSTSCSRCALIVLRGVAIVCVA